MPGDNTEHIRAKLKSLEEQRNSAALELDRARHEVNASEEARKRLTFELRSAHDEETRAAIRYAEARDACQRIQDEREAFERELRDLENAAAAGELPEST